MIDSHQDQGVLQLVINRPEKKNALTRAMYQQLSDAVIRANRARAIPASGFCRWLSGVAHPEAQ